MEKPLFCHHGHISGNSLDCLTYKWQVVNNSGYPVRTFAQDELCDAINFALIIGSKPPFNFYVISFLENMGDAAQCWCLPIGPHSRLNQTK